jgi:hypothetical protein
MNSYLVSQYIRDKGKISELEILQCPLPSNKLHQSTIDYYNWLMDGGFEHDPCLRISKDFDLYHHD